jgi:hypothetical protein
LPEAHEYMVKVAALDDGDPARVSRMIFSEFLGNKAQRAIFEQSQKEGR